MALSRITYTADGTTQVFGVTFPFLSRDHVFVYVNGSAATFTWQNDSTVTITTPTVNASDKVKIERRTESTSVLVDWVEGASMTEADLDTATLQTFYLSQEALDDAGEALILALDGSGSWDALNNKMVNLANPTLAQDAATKSYVDTENAAQSAAILASEAAAAASAAAASTSAGNAATSETNAGVSETNAGVSETNAAASAAQAALNAGNARWGGTAGGTVNALTLTPGVALGAYALGVGYWFISAGTNTNATVTVDISGLGAVNIKSRGGGALGIGDMPKTGEFGHILHDGTDFELVNTYGNTVLDSQFASNSLRYKNNSGTMANATITEEQVVQRATGGEISGLTVPASTFVGRKSTGSIAAVTMAEARTLLNVADGAEVNPTAASQAEMEAGTESALRSVSPLRVKQAITAFGADKVLISSASASSSSSVDFTSGIGSGTYLWYELWFQYAVPATDDVAVFIRLRTNSTWRTSSYAYASSVQHSANTTPSVAVSGGSAGNFYCSESGTGNRVGSASGEGAMGVVRFCADNTSQTPLVQWHVSYVPAGTGWVTNVIGSGTYLTASEPLDGIRFMFESGNVASGEFSLYGIKGA